MKERLHYIDQLKGLAIILVIMGHVVQYSIGGETATWLYRDIYIFHMPLFFFLSGLVAHLAKDGIARATGRKAFQLLVPMLAWGVLMTLFLNATYWQFLTHPYKLGYWYLLVLFIFYLALFLAGGIASLCKRHRRAALTILLVAGYLVVRKLGGVIWTWPTAVLLLCSDHVVGFYPYFFLGVMAGQFNIGAWVKGRQSVVVAVLALTLVPLVCLYNGEKGAVATTMGAVIVALLYALFIGNASSSTPALRYLDRIGRHTLIIYMVHFFLVQLINIQPLAAWLEHTVNPLLLIILVAVLSVGIAELCLLAGQAIGCSWPLEALLLGKVHKRKARQQSSIQTYDNQQ